MKIIHKVHEMRTLVSKLRLKGKSLGFVPTMGALHEGHRSLLRRGRQENDGLIASIFINPFQFGPKEDFHKYPRTLAADRKILLESHVDILFMPTVQEMYPTGFTTVVEVPALTQTLCGISRPGHFKGVTTVVAKLFEIVQPTRAYFGEKDYQQVRVIQRMVEDLAIPVRIVACPTAREKDGLACSSRNRYLSAKEREEAVKLYQALYLGRELVQNKIMMDSALLKKRLSSILSTIPHGRIDYLEVVDPVTLLPMKKIHRPALLAGAIYIGKTRLIDNVVIS